MPSVNSSTSDQAARRGARLKYVREQSKRSEADFAESLGISLSDLAAMETGDLPITGDVYYSLATKYRVDFYTMHNGTSSPFEATFDGVPNHITNEAIVKLLSAGIKVTGERHVTAFTEILRDAVQDCYPTPRQVNLSFLDFDDDLDPSEYGEIEAYPMTPMKPPR